MGIHDLYLSFEETTEREKGKNLGERLNIAQIAQLWSKGPTEQDRLKQVMLCQFYEGVLKGLDVKKQAEERLEAHRNELRKAENEASDPALRLHYSFELANTYRLNNYQTPFRSDSDGYFLNIEISRDEFLSWLKAIDEPRPANCLLAFWWNDSSPIDEASTVKPTAEIKVLLPMVRGSTESLLLIYYYLESKGINAGDTVDISAKIAWGEIHSGKFETDLIKDRVGSRGTARLIMNGGEELDYEIFAKKYKSRLKIPDKPK